MQPTNHLSLFSILQISRVAGLVTTGWLAGCWVARSSPFSLSCEKGTIEPQSLQSRAAPLSPPIHNKTTTTKKARKRGARETVLVCFSSDVYTLYVVLLSDRHLSCSYVSLFCSTKNNQQNLFWSPPHWLCCCLFLKPGFLLRLISQCGKKI